MKELPYVTAFQMRQMEEAAVKSGISVATLMENAGEAVAEETRRMCKNGEVAVFCGYGNNGGDGFVAAGHLLRNGYQVKVFLAGKPKQMSAHTSANYQALIALGHTPEIITTLQEIETKCDAMAKPDLIVDALFGIGIRDVLDDFYVTLINKINSLGAAILAVDIPSGLGADSGKPQGAAIRATKTITFGCAKIGLKNPEAKQYVGDLVIADIGLFKYV